MAEEKFIPNFKKKYLETVAPELYKEFGYKTVMQIPKIEKITVSVGVGEATVNKKLLDAAVKELEQITGQHVVKTKARKSIANFKIRAGQEIGAMVTLRGDNMWYFLERQGSHSLLHAGDSLVEARGVAFGGRGLLAEEDCCSRDNHEHREDCDQELPCVRFHYVCIHRCT